MKFLTLFVAVTFLAACGARSTDEERVRELFADAEEAAESRDASDVLEFVATDYSDARGFDRSQLQSFLRGYFLANPKVEVLLGIDSLELPVPGLAKARVDITVLPAGDRATLDVELRQENGEWRVARADAAGEGS